MPTIRLATPDDAEAIREIYAPFCIDSPVSFETVIPTVEEMRSRVVKILEILPWLVAVDDTCAVLGYAYASRHKERAAYVWSVDASVYVRAGMRRSGLGRALYTSLFASLELQGFYHVLAGATLPNPSSVGLHESMGFERIGIYPAIGYKCGAWHDVLWWRLLLREPREGVEPAPLLEFAEVKRLPGWNEALEKGRALLH